MVELRHGHKKLSPQCNVIKTRQKVFNFGLRHLLLLILLYAPVTSQAENLVDIFQLAIENDSELKAAQSAKQALLTKEPQAYSKFYPRISAESSTGKVSQDLIAAANATTFDPFSQVVQDESLLGRNIYSQFNAKLSLVQPLYDVKIFRNRKVAEVDTVKAELEYRIAQQDLIFRVAESYFNVLASTDELNFARSEKNAITRQLEQTKQRFQVGLTAVTDVHEAQARHDLALAQEIKAETEVAKQQEILRRITGTIHNDLMRLKVDMPLIPPSPSSIVDWTDAARSQNFDVAVIKYDADKIRYQMEVMRGENFPKIELRASYGYNKWGGPYSQESTDAIIALDINMSLFEGNAVNYKVAELQHKFDEAIFKVDLKEKMVLQITRQAYLGVLAGMSYVKALQQALQSSEKALRATNAGFEVGTRTAIEVLDAQRELFRGQRDYASARYEYLLNTLQLKKAVGLLSIDDLEQINNWLE